MLVCGDGDGLLAAVGTRLGEAPRLGGARRPGEARRLGEGRLGEEDRLGEPLLRPSMLRKNPFLPSILCGASLLELGEDGAMSGPLDSVRLFLLTNLFFCDEFEEVLPEGLGEEAALGGIVLFTCVGGALFSFGDSCDEETDAVIIITGDRTTIFGSASSGT